VSVCENRQIQFILSEFPRIYSFGRLVGMESYVNSTQLANQTYHYDNNGRLQGTGETLRGCEKSQESWDFASLRSIMRQAAA
jgi:hypothetical protein